VAEFLAPYKDIILAIGHGNHETAIDRHNQVQLLHDLAQELGGDTPVPVMGYEWWVAIELVVHGNTRAAAKMYLHHGFGGANRVGKGVPHFGYLAATHDADVYVMGHTHNATLHPMVRCRIEGSKAGLKVLSRSGWAIRPSTYKRRGTWEKEKGFDPTPLGGTLVTFAMKTVQQDNVQRVQLQIRPTGWYEA
jgi:hypothetical protein